MTAEYSSKHLKSSSNQLDSLTDLPINVKHLIQQHLSIEDAARMSVLSKPWRHVWAEISTLKFSRRFCLNKPSDTLIDIVNTILSQHSGAIKTFRLNISRIPSYQHSVIDQWMLLLSQKGVKNLTLQNLHNKDLYTLPSCIYGVELERLNLSKCIFRPPYSFRGFHRIKRLVLILVTLDLIDVVATNSFLWMPNLVRLQVRACHGTLHHWKINAPKLSRLFYQTSSLKLDHLMDCRKLQKVILLSDGYEENPMNLTDLLNCWPEICYLVLGSYYLKCFTYSSTDEPKCLNNLKVLSPYDFDFDDEKNIYALLRMLRTCPNLEQLLCMSSSDLELLVYRECNLQD